MKKIISILGSLLFITAVKAQTVVKKETTNPGSGQTTGTATSSKDPKASHTDLKVQEAKKAEAERAAKDAKIAQQVDPKILPAKDPKAAHTTDPKVEEAKKAAAERAAKDAKIAQQVDPKTISAKDPKAAHTDPKVEAAQKAAAERAAKNANTQQKGN